MKGPVKGSPSTVLKSMVFLSIIIYIYIYMLRMLDLAGRPDDARSSAATVILSSQSMILFEKELNSLYMHYSRRTFMVHNPRFDEYAPL